MRKTMPRGFRDEGANPKVAVMFDEEIFDKIKKMALKERRSFSAMVCELCKVGILDLEESDRLEPEAELELH
jgi:predicted CopG family antitoxin